MKKFLHVGCGVQTKKSLKGFDTDEWQEVRFDIDPTVEPDIIGSLMDMSQVEDSSVDAIYSAHNIEHVHFFDVMKVLEEFHRVLKPDGFLVITCPNLEQACRIAGETGLMTVLYHAVVGPITAMDVIFGHRGMSYTDNPFMMHKVGFSPELLAEALTEAKFKNIVGGARLERFDIWYVATKNESTKLQELAEEFLP